MNKSDLKSRPVCNLHITENTALSGKNTPFYAENPNAALDLYKYSVNKHKENAEKCPIFYENLRNICAKFDKTA